MCALLQSRNIARDAYTIILTPMVAIQSFISMQYAKKKQKRVNNSNYFRTSEYSRLAMTTNDGRTTSSIVDDKQTEQLPEFE